MKWLVQCDCAECMKNPEWPEQPEEAAIKSLKQKYGGLALVS